MRQAGDRQRPYVWTGRGRRWGERIRRSDPRSRCHSRAAEAAELGSRVSRTHGQSGATHGGTLFLGSVRRRGGRVADIPPGQRERALQPSGLSNWAPVVPSARFARRMAISAVTEYARSEVIAAPSRPKSGSRAARPTTVTSNPAPSATLASSGRFTPFKAASRTRLVPSATLAISRILVTAVAGTKSEPNTIRSISGARISSGITTAVVATAVRNAYSLALVRRSPGVSALATPGRAAKATEKPIMLESEVMVQATT